MSASPVDRPACLSADDVRRIVREEMRTDRERVRQLAARVELLADLLGRIRRVGLTISGILKE